MRESYDCVVVGGGPAGSTVAALVAAAGRRTLLVERDSALSGGVGQSLLPESYWTLARLGVLEQVGSGPFLNKRGVQFLSPVGDEELAVSFPDHDPRPSALTWQVARPAFDRLLFDNARQHGADCRLGVRAVDVLFDGERAVGVRLAPAGEPTREVAARVVVDATGRHGLLASRLELRVPDEQLRKVAMWGYYRGARRESGRSAGDTVIAHTRSRQAWFWFIPLADDVTSIGLVTDARRLLAAGGDAALLFEDELVDCPVLIERLLHADLIGKLHVARDFSYATRRHAGEGWVLVGDAAGYIDPVFCTGIHLALKTGELAADALCEGLARGDLSAQQLGRWSGAFDAGLARLRQLVQAFYCESFRFADFLRDRPEHRGALASLLMGRVLDADADPALDDLAAWLAEPPPRPASEIERAES